MTSPKRLVFKFNKVKQFTGRSGRQKVVAQVADAIKAAALEIGADDVITKLENYEKDIRAAVDKDLTTFTGTALRFFLNQQSPDTTKGGDRTRKPGRGGPAFQIGNTITFRDNGSLTGMRVTPNQANQAPEFSVIWAALRPSTIRRKFRGKTRKREALTYFVMTGALENGLESGLRATFRQLLDFKITLVRGQPGSANVVTVQAIPSSTITAAVIPALGGKSINTPGRNGPIIAFLTAKRDDAIRSKFDESTRYKLDNPHGATRPFLEPMLGYWLTRRFPAVFGNAVAKALKG